jgi:hypothetical protein
MRLVASFAVAALSFAVGCGGDSVATNADPAQAASDAFALYDKDGNGELAAAELDAALAIKSAVARIDADKNGVVAKEELQQRFITLKQGSSTVSVSVTVLGPKGPLAGADVTLTPEPFMGTDLPTYTGTTIEGGNCELKTGDVPVYSLPWGLYRVHVVHAADGIDKTVGCEVSDDLGSRLTIKLQ